MIFSLLFRASNYQIVDKNNCIEFCFKTISSEIRFHINSGLT